MRLTALVVVGMLGLSPAAEPARGVEVLTAGAMRTVMHDGDLSPAIHLATLRDREHLYAVGPLEGLRGEITVWDGRPSIARVVGGAITVTDDHEVGACFLVYAQVDAWREIAIPAGVRDAGQLESFVREAASTAGLDPSRPFPFAVTGTFDAVRFHIVDKTDDGPHGADKHEQVKVHFATERLPGKVLGFHSDGHHGVFTHHDTDVHMHVVSDDGKQSGHVESLELGPGCTVLLPRSGP